MALPDPFVTVALTWLCIVLYAVVMYYWTVVPQYERNVAPRVNP